MLLLLSRRPCSGLKPSPSARRWASAPGTPLLTMPTSSAASEPGGITGGWLEGQGRGLCSGKTSQFGAP